MKQPDKKNFDIADAICEYCNKFTGCFIDFDNRFICFSCSYSAGFDCFDLKIYDQFVESYNKNLAEAMKHDDFKEVY